jgi:hypothetical protein
MEKKRLLKTFRMCMCVCENYKHKHEHMQKYRFLEN